MSVKIVLTLALLANTTLSWGFGATGHRIVGELAERHLTVQARQNVHRILAGQSLAEASTLQYSDNTQTVH